MEHQDFDLDGLARYLHLSRDQVQRMADRGKLPGRKIAGQWRFPAAEIHHWLETRIGVSDDVELQQVERTLDRQAGGDAEVSIIGMLPLAAIAVPLEARTRGSVIDRMTSIAANTGLLWDPEKMASAVRERESLHPTALDNGVALLHPRRPMPTILAEPFLALGRTHQGVPFSGARGVLTDLFFLICSISDREHLRTLARLSRLVNDATFLQGAREAPDALSLHEWVAEREAALFNADKG
jgi:PTS system nitrogen regulatory IIA component